MNGFPFPFSRPLPFLPSSPPFSLFYLYRLGGWTKRPNPSRSKAANLVQPRPTDGVWFACMGETQIMGRRVKMRTHRGLWVAQTPSLVGVGGQAVDTQRHGSHGVGVPHPSRFGQYIVHYVRVCNPGGCWGKTGIVADTYCTLYVAGDGRSSL